LEREGLGSAFRVSNGDHGIGCAEIDADGRCDRSPRCCHDFGSSQGDDGYGILRRYRKALTAKETKETDLHSRCKAIDRADVRDVPIPDQWAAANRSF
jgi:hypothetical protein